MVVIRWCELDGRIVPLYPGNTPDGVGRVVGITVAGPFELSLMGELLSSWMEDAVALQAGG